MSGDRTLLQFEATLGGVKVSAPKLDKDGSIVRGAELQVSLSIPQPPTPAEPVKPWQYGRPRPAVPAQLGDEPDSAYETRVRGDREKQSEYDRAIAFYESQVEEHYEARRVARERTLAFAQLVGIAAVFGNKPVTVTIEPADQDILPGFQASLLGAAEDGSS